MKRRIALVSLVAGVAAGAAATAIALTAGGGFDEGPYDACVKSSSGDLRMVDEAGLECKKGEYAISWANGYSISGYELEFYGEENVTTASWFHQLGCPDGSEPLGGGGAFLPDSQEPAGGMALASSIPGHEEGENPGWEVRFDTVDGEEHTGTFQIYAICAPASRG